MASKGYVCLVKQTQRWPYLYMIVCLINKTFAFSRMRQFGQRFVTVGIHGNGPGQTCVTASEAASQWRLSLEGTVLSVKPCNMYGQTAARRQQGNAVDVSQCPPDLPTPVQWQYSPGEGAQDHKHVDASPVATLCNFRGDQYVPAMEDV